VKPVVITGFEDELCRANMSDEDRARVKRPTSILSKLQK